MFCFRCSSIPRRVLPFALAAAAVTAASVSGAEPEPITAEQRALTQVPWQPEAAAVVLFEKAELRFMKYPQEASSYLKVRTRLKILKEEGKAYGEVSIPHSSFLRLTEFEGRTVLPDGRELPVAEDAVFRQRSSRARKNFVTKAAFPAVEIGAILDYGYTLRWDSIYYLSPWFFNNEVPTLLSEITYIKPGNMSLKTWAARTGRNDFMHEEKTHPRGVSLRVWMEDLPSVPDEPHSFPFADLSSRFMLVPKEVMVSGTRWPVLDTWRTVCDDFETSIYVVARRKSRQAKKRAAAIAGAEKNPRDKAAAIYAFVRDQIRTDHTGWVLTSADSGADRVLSEKQGNYADQAILLQAMLEGVKIKSKLVWASDRREGRSDLSVANPWWFEKVLVMLDDGRTFLDPSDRRLGFGHLSPYLEGTPAVVHHKKPEVVALPETAFAESTRQARLALAIDAEGRIAGTGSLLMTGHHAWQVLRWKDDDEATAAAWQEWLAGNFADFEVDGVKVEESLDQRRVQVGWRVLQHQEEVLGDEASLTPSLPLGPIEQPFALPQRRTPVQFAFADRDQVELSLSWPEGWEVAAQPEAVDFQTAAGALVSGVEIDEAGRSLTYSRRFDVVQRELAGKALYPEVRGLYGAVESHDAQALVLVRP